MRHSNVLGGKGYSHECRFNYVLRSNHGVANYTVSSFVRTFLPVFNHRCMFPKRFFEITKAMRHYLYPNFTCSETECRETHQSFYLICFRKVIIENEAGSIFVGVKNENASGAIRVHWSCQSTCGNPNVRRSIRFRFWTFD